MAEESKRETVKPPRQRGHGESTIVQRPDGSWMGQVSFGSTADGKRIRKTAYGTTRADVVKKVKQLEAQRTAGLPVAVKDVTVEHLMTRWLSEVVKPTLKETTFRSYEQMTRVHIIPTIGKCKLSKLDVIAIEEFLRSKLHPCITSATGLSSRTVRYLRMLLRCAWRYGIKWKWVPGGLNIILATDPIKVRERKSPTLSGDEFSTLIKAFSGHRYEAVYITALGLGLRIGETLGLRWEDITFDAVGSGTVTITYQLQRVGGKLQLTSPKSDASQRTLLLPKFVTQALKRRAEDQQQEQLLRGEGWHNEMGLVFTNQFGGALDYHRVRQRYRDLLTKSDAREIIQKLRIHDLRHLAASFLLSEQVSVKDIAAHLGHADEYLVIRTYSHVMMEGKRLAAAAMDRVYEKRVQTGVETE